MPVNQLLLVLFTVPIILPLSLMLVGCGLRSSLGPANTRRGGKADEGCLAPPCSALLMPGECRG